MQHRITRAKYNEATGKWHLTIKRPRNSDIPASEPLKRPNYDDWEEFHDIVDVLFTGVGSLSRWSWPDIAGLETFSGKVIHSADWNTNDHLDSWKDKKVGVIGVVCDLCDF